MKKYLSTITIIILIMIFIYGCCNRKGSDGMNDLGNIPSANLEVFYREAVVNEDGRMPTITFPSGAKIETNNDATMRSGVVVTVLEEKRINTGDEKIGLPSDYIYVYTVKAVYKSDNPLIEDVQVTTLEKPFTVTIPNPVSDTGLCYVAVKTSESEPWRFSRVTDQITKIANTVPSRAAEQPAPKECKFELYRAGVQLALAIMKPDALKPETVIDGIVATSTSAVLMNSKSQYCDDLFVKSVLKGVNMESFDDSDLVVRLTYRNNSEIPDRVKVNGKLVRQSNFNDSCIEDGRYSHSFDITNLISFAKTYSEAEYSFTLNIKGMAEEDFPKRFLIEFFSRKESGLSQPLVYSQYVTFDSYSDVLFSIAPEKSSFADENGNILKLNPRFFVTSSHKFDKADRDKIANSISVSNLSGQKLAKIWSEDELTLSFDSYLATDTTYIVTMASDTGIENITVIGFDDHKFTTMGDVTITLSDADKNIFDSQNGLYRIDPAFTIDLGYMLDDEDKKKIADSISISTVSNNRLEKKWDNSRLSVGIIGGLDSSTNYVLSMKEPSDVEGYSIKCFEDLDFTTMDGIKVELNSPESNIFDESDKLFRINPTFSVTPSFSFSDNDKKKIADAVSVSNIASSSLTKTWENDVLNISFKNKLDATTKYTVTMASDTGIEGVDISVFKDFSFTTMDEIDVTLDSNHGNVIDKERGLYKLNPTFTVKTSYSFKESDREKIAKSVSVTGVDSSQLVVNWTASDSFTLSFKETLKDGETYNVKMSSDTGVDEALIKAFDSFEFTTKGAVTFNVTTDPSCIFNEAENIYRLNPAFYVKPSFTFGKEDRNIIANSIHLSGIEDERIKKEWNDNTLKISFLGKLDINRDYDLTMDSSIKIDGVKVKPFEKVSFSTIGALVINIKENDGSVFDDGNGLYRLNPTFTISPNLPLTEKDKDNIVTSISVSGVTKSETTMEWRKDDEYEKLIIGFINYLEPGHGYSINMANSIDVSGMVVVGFGRMSFNTMDRVTATYEIEEGSIFDDGKGFYRLDPVFVVTPSVTFNDSDKELFANAVSIKGVAHDAINRDWVGNSLRITQKDYLTPKTSFSLSLSADTGISGVVVKPFRDFPFNTMDEVVVTLASTTGSVFDEPEQFYRLNPTFVVTPSVAFNTTDRALVEKAVNISGVDHDDLVMTWVGDSIRLAVNHYLNPNVDYTVSLNTTTGIRGIVAKPFADFTFRTMRTINIALASDTGRVFDEPDQLYRLNPSFTINPDYVFNDTDKAVILNALSVDGVSESKVIKAWDGNIIRLSFDGYLEPDTSYVIKLGDLTAIEAISFNKFANHGIKTMPVITFSIDHNGNDLFDASPSHTRYRLNTSFTATSTYAFTRTSDWQQIFDAISVSVIDSGKVTKNHGTNNVAIGFTEYLTQGTTYTVSMTDPGMDGILVTPFPARTITTMERVTLTLATNAGSYFNESEGLYMLDPTFTVTSTYDFNTSDKAIISSCLLVSDLAESGMSKTWSGTSLGLSFVGELDVGRTYTISMADLSAIEAIDIEVFPQKVFNTVENNTLTVRHYQMNIDNNNYTLYETENLSRRVKSDQAPSVKTYTGFTSPTATTINISYNSTNEINYYYSRNSYTLTVNKGTGISTVSGDGTYKFGKSVTVTATCLAGYQTPAWSGYTTASTFTMPAINTTMTANASLIKYTITYNYDGGSATNVDNYYVTTNTFTLVNPTKSGFTFVGWTGSNGTKAQTSVSITKGSTENKSYKANWLNNSVVGGSVVTYGGCRLVVVNSAMSWTDARNYAIAMGGELVMIKSADMQNKVMSYLAGNANSDFWIGLNDAASEGTWRYNDGTLAGTGNGSSGGFSTASGMYTNWNSGEPNNSSGENYAEFYKGTGLWNDLNGSQALPFVVQFGTP